MRGSWGRFFVAGLGGALLSTAWTSPTWAADATLVVTREALPGDVLCPDTETLVTRIRAVRPTGLSFGEGPEAPRLRVVFGREPDGTLRAQIHTTGPVQGDRTLLDKGTGCSALGEAVAVTIALLLDGTTPTRRPTPLVPPPSERTKPAGQIFVAGGLTNAGVSALAPKLAGELVFHPLGRAVKLGPEIGAGFVYVPGVDATLTPGKVTTSAAFGTVRAGVRVGFGESAARTESTRFALVPSAQISVGSVRAEGAGFSEDRAQSRVFGRAGLALPLVWEIGWGVALRVVAEGDVAFRRQRFVVDAVPTAAEVPRVGGSLTLGVGLALF